MTLLDQPTPTPTPTPAPSESKLVPYVRRNGEGPSYAVVNDPMRLVAGEEAMGKDCTLLEYNPLAGTGAPMHVHHNEDESFYIIRGQVKVRYMKDGQPQDVVCVPGDFIHFPRGLEHGFRCLSDCKFLILLHPGGMEHFYKAMGELENPADVGQMTSCCAMYGITVTGPGLLIEPL